MAERLDQTSMRTIGQMLKERRLAKGLTLVKVEQATKIREKFLTAIENDDYRLLPSVAYAKGFVKNYGEFLGFSTNEVLAFFRRQTADAARSTLLPIQSKASQVPPWYRLTPRRFLILIASLLLTALLIYFVSQYKRLHTSPRLVITAPADQAVSAQRRIDVVGETDPDATLTINGVSVAVRSDGQFFDQVPLETGKNNITVTATSRFGQITTQTRVVTRSNE